MKRFRLASCHLPLHMVQVFCEFDFSMIHECVLQFLEVVEHEQVGAKVVPTLERPLFYEKHHVKVD